ncbi:MAG: hypothetical protein RLY35_140 [Bacteroidota bacterium]|jgi:uncharacterized protein (TIGR02145 family)
MFKNTLTLLLLFLSTSIAFAQSDIGIPYQGILRDNNGAEMVNTSATIQSIIRINSVNGQIIFSESHQVVTDGFGYFLITIGSGTVNNSFPAFSQIDWSTNLKFLQIQVNFGSGFVDLGTTQLLSVPYALFADDCNCDMSISPIGDTLFTGGGGFLIVPGISNANPEFGGIGLIVLPGNNYCAAQQMSVTTCGGNTTYTYEGYTYDLIEINNQCWFAENLRASKFNDGTPIDSVANNAAWASSLTPAFCKYGNSNTNGNIYGNLYNFYAVETGNLCPVGWHVPTDCEWMFLESNLGLNTSIQQTTGWRGTDEGAKLKSTNLWLNITDPSITPNSNSLLFDAVPGGFRIYSTNASAGLFNALKAYAYFWTSTPSTTSSAYYRGLFYNYDTILRLTGNKATGASVRCIRD